MNTLGLIIIIAAYLLSSVVKVDRWDIYALLVIAVLIGIGYLWRRKQIKKAGDTADGPLTRNDIIKRLLISSLLLSIILSGVLYISDKTSTTAKELRKSGEAFINSRKYPEAINDFTGAIKLEPNSPRL